MPRAAGIGDVMAAVVERETFALPRSVAADTEVFAIGDIHGRTDLLHALIDEAAREPRRRQKRALVFLGDLIDRGPDSLGTVDLALAAGARVGASEAIGLMGNHETMMRLALDPRTPWGAALAALANWLRNGGGAVVRQFLNFEVRPIDPEELLTMIRVALPERIRAWLEGLRANWRSDAVLFVHAGVNPTVDLERFLALPWNTPLDQMEEDRHWAWVRWPFLDASPGPGGFSGYFVVHGHTPNDARPNPSHEAQIRDFRLNLDAGSGKTGLAKMGVFRGSEVKVLTALGPTNAMLGRAHG